jgi:hypothetical protein
MNPLEAASEEPGRGQAARIISKKIASEPILLVEGKSDRNLLRRKWQDIHRDDSRNINIEEPEEKGGKEVVLAEFTERRKKELMFVLVDMDFDLKSEKIDFSSSAYDTGPFVTLATHYFPDDNAAKKIIRSVVSESGVNYKERLDDKTIESIIRISKVLTWIKLYKGRWPKNQNRFGNFTWGEVEHDESNNALFQDSICKLELTGTDNKREFKEYVEHNFENLNECGINDHALSHAVLLLLDHWDCGSKLTNIGSKRWKLAQTNLEEKYFLKYIEEKSSIKDDEFILKLRDNITQK